jgi:hypothetical protein
MTDCPHFSLPFRFSNGQAAVTEQDSIDEIADCALAVMLCPRGYRAELPAFGIPDPTFSSSLAVVDELRMTVAIWEPRLSALISGELDPVDELIQHVLLRAQVQTQE